MEDRLRCLEAVLRDHGVDCDLAGLARAWQQGELGLYIYLRASPELRRQLDLWIMDQIENMNLLKVRETCLESARDGLNSKGRGGVLTRGWTGVPQFPGGRPHSSLAQQQLA